MSGAGVYVHLPFCPYLCPYCDFAKWPLRAGDAARYLRALYAQIAAAPFFPATTAFFGGGTPNTYAPDEVASLVGGIRTRFTLPPGAEFTIEVNPDLALCEGFSAYRAAGATRLSIGVQSFDDAEIRVLGRRHTEEDVRAVVARAREAGFENISLDLIFAVPGQTPATWRRSLEAAIGLGVEHISAYGLTVEAGTPYADWRVRDPGAFTEEDLEAEMYGLAIETLRRAGYEQYEISNFARPGFRCAHNQTYWNNDAYLGLGVGATTYIEGVRRTTTRDLRVYCESAQAGVPIPAESESLVGAARAGEAVMLALRRVEGVEIAAFAQRYGIDFLAFYRPVIAEMQAAGVLTVGPTHVALTERGRFVANDVCAAFLPRVTREE